MKKLKLFLVGFAVSVSAAMYGNSPVRFIDVNAVSHEIEIIMEQSLCEPEEGFAVTVFFSISEENRIQELQIASSNQELNAILLMKLENQELTGPSWRLGKIYELSVISAQDGYITSVENL